MSKVESPEAYDILSGNNGKRGEHGERQQAGFSEVNNGQKNKEAHLRS